MKTKYSYRKKGRYADGTNKIIIVKQDKDGTLTKFLLKPKILWDLLESRDFNKGKRDFKNHEQREFLVNKND